MKTILSVWLTFLVVGTALAQAPLWDMAKDNIPADLRHGGTYHADGTVSLKAGEWFGLPASLFPDPRNFTVQITVGFPTLVEENYTNVLLKQPGPQQDTGFGLSCIYGKANGYKIYRPIINGMHIGQNKMSYQPGTKYVFTVTARNNMMAYYLNDILGSRHFTMLLPNDEPLWVGKPLMDREQPFASMEVTELKVFGSDYTYVSPKQKVESEPRGAIAGKNWVIDAPTVIDPARPKILFYGDSISEGYRNDLLAMLEGKVYAYHWTHFVHWLNSSVTPLIKEGAATANYRAIFFNNGLHSLHWTSDKATDQQIMDQTRAIVRGFKQGAPQAKLFWITTTPHCAKRPAPGEPVQALGEKNEVVLRINRLAEQVMKEEQVEMIDVYAPLAARLDLSNGDGYHWSGPAYQLIAQAVAAKTFQVIGEEAKTD